MDESLQVLGTDAVTPSSQGASGLVRHLIRFRGKSGRLEFLAVGLGGWIAIFMVSFILYFIELLIEIQEATLTTIWAAVALPIYVWLNLTVSVRRLHDLGHSGWAILIGLIPIVNLFFSLYLFLAPGRSDPQS